MKNKTKLWGLFLLTPFLLSANGVSNYGTMSEWGRWSEFYFSPMAQAGESSKSYRGVFTNRKVAFFSFKVGITNDKYPNEYVIGNSLNYYVRALSIQNYYLDFSIPRDILNDENNKLRVVVEAADVNDVSIVEARQQYFFVFSLAKERRWSLNPGSGSGYFTRAEGSDGAGAEYNSHTNNFSYASYRTFYYGFAASYQNPRFNRIPLSEWTFRSLDLRSGEVSPLVQECYLRIDENQSDFEGYGEVHYENALTYRTIPLALTEVRDSNDHAFGHLSLRDAVAISKDGRRVKKLTEAGPGDLITHNVYLPPLSNGVAAKSYNVRLVLKGCGEFHLDTIEATIPISKTHNLVGACANSDWCVEEG
jgi:hypothetical protein